MNLFGNIKAQNDQLEAKYTELEAAFLSLNAEHEAANKKIGTLETSLTKANADIAQLMASLSGLTAKFTALEQGASEAILRATKEAQAQAPAVAGQIIASLGVPPVAETGSSSDPYASMDRSQLLAEWKKIKDLNAKNAFYQTYLAEGSALRKAVASCL